MTGQSRQWKLRELFDTARHPFVVLDDQLSVVDANRAFLDVLHTEPTQVEGKKLFEIPTVNWEQSGLRHCLERFADDGQPVCDRYFRISIASTPRRIFEVDVRTISGSVGDVTYLVELSDVTEAARGMMVTRLLSQNAALTSSERSVEQALEYCVDAICQFLDWPVGHVYLVDQNNLQSLISSNIWRFGRLHDLPSLRHWSAEHHIAPGQDVVGRVWQEGKLHWVEDLQKEIQDRRRHLFQELDLRSYFVLPIFVESRVYALLEFFHALHEPLTDDIERSVLSIAEPVGHVIQRHQDLQRLQEAKRDAEQANQAKGQLLNNVTHELRTPLNSILGMLHLAMNCDDATELQAYFVNAKESADSLMVLLDDIVSLSRARDGTLKVANEWFQIRRATEEMLRVAARRAQAKGLGFEVAVDQDVPEVVQLDPRHFRQMLLNLVSNAVKFTGKGGVHVRIGLGGERNAELKVEVVDTGVGISASDLSRIFTPFTQVDASLTRAHGGAGLGLATCRELVHAMGGTLTAENVPNEGSRFTTLLPLNVGGEDEDAVSHEKQASNKQLRILLVEDIPANQFVVTKLLQREGHFVEVRANGLEAVEAVYGDSYDVVLMDIQMPVMDGYQATRKIREWEVANRVASIPIIAITAHASAEDRQQCLNAGMNEYLPKPIDVGVLNETLAKLARRGNN